jgi:hypothetical protein
MSLLARNPNLYYGSGRRRHVRHRRHGGSILGSISDFLKKHRIISTIGSALGGVGVPYASAIGKAAGVLGYGRRRRRRVVRRRAGLGRRRTVRRRRGGDIRSVLSGVHSFVKNNRLISKGLRTFLPNSSLHKAAHALGYGRRRHSVRRRRGGSLRSVLSGVHSFVKSNRLISKGLRTFLPNSNLHKAAHTLGYGRRRHTRHRVHHRGGANYFTTEQIAMPKF